ncbi:MAG: DUF4290 domain-containing protein [Bacteroidota bacterium]
MKEYGTNVQKLVDYILTIEDREKRTKYAYLLTELMRQVHPNMRDAQDYTNKLWDDLYILSGFKLEVDSPFAPPPIDAVGKRPKFIPYNMHNLKYKHYGRNIELLVEKAINEPNEEEQIITVAYLLRLMKAFYTSWNKEIVEEAVIYNQLDDLSKGKLQKAIEVVKNEGILESSPRFNRAQNSNTRNNFSRNNNTNTNSQNNRGRLNTGMRDRNNNSGRNFKPKN